MEMKKSRMKMGRGGFVLTVDAVIAMSFILIIAIALSAQRYNNISETTELAFVNLHYISEDALDALNKQGILDRIGEYWTSNDSGAASDLARLYLDDLVPKNAGYRLLIYNNTSTMGYTALAENYRVSDIDSIAKTYALRFLIGYQKGTPVLSSVSRAFLTGIRSKTSSAYAYFGGFEGQGNLTKYLYVPGNATIIGAYMEMDAGSQFILRINGASCGTYAPSGRYLAADNWTLAPNWFTLGKNTIELDFIDANFTEEFIGGGFMRVTYNTTSLNESVLTGSDKFEFPGINGLINYYGSFYVPGALTSMTAHIVFQNNYTTFLRVGDDLVYSSSGSPTAQTWDLNDAYLQSKLNYNGISGKTIPLRLGTSNISSIIREGTADVVLITDLSGSMNNRISSDSSGTTVTDCSNETVLLQSTTKRVSLAKCLDKKFVNIILNSTDNSVALVGFTDDADSASYNLNFSSDNTTLINKIGTYPNTPAGGTCICCAINRAYEMLADRETSIDHGGEWKYRNYTTTAYTILAAGASNWKSWSHGSCTPTSSCDPTAASPAACTPALNATAWQTEGFNDSSWQNTTLPTLNASLADYMFYYRKHFTLPAGITSTSLYLRHSRGIQCYLNGVQVIASGTCSDGSGWDSAITITPRPSGQDNVLACRVRSSTKKSVGIIFDARINAIAECGDSCDPSSASIPIPSACAPSGDWADEGFDDGSWAAATLPKTANSEENSVFYYRKHFTVPYDASGGGVLYLRNSRGAECYLNGNSIGTDTACTDSDNNPPPWGNTWKFSASYFNSPGQDNVLSCRLRSGTGSGKNGIEFDAQLIALSGRNKFIVVMSDGVTGYCCGGTEGACASDGVETAGVGDTQDYNGNLYCNGNPPNCNDAYCTDHEIPNAIWSAGRAHINLTTTLHSVGFGPVTSCTNGRYTLQQIAAVGNGSYCASTNATQLRDCYVQFANDILMASVKSQIVNITGFATISTLSPESYLSYTYAPNVPTLEYGEITLSYDTERFNDNATCIGRFYIPEGVTAVDAKATSYSSEHWTDYLEINSYKGFDLSDYIGAPDLEYFDLGDPYVVYMNPANIISGLNNTVHIETGDMPRPSNRTSCSSDNRAILTIKMSGGVGYGDTFPNAEGCLWSVGFEDGSFLANQPIPFDYAGNSTCAYPDSNFTANNTDAINDAIYRVFDQLDRDNNGLLDIKFDPTQIAMESSRVGGVRSLYGPVQFKLVVWM